MPDNQRFRVWQEAQKLASDVNRFADTLPPSKSGELRSQLRNAATSLRENLAEGTASRSGESPGSFIVDSVGSINELEALYFLSQRMGFANPDRIQPTLSKLGDVKKRVFALRKTLVATK